LDEDSENDSDHEAEIALMKKDLIYNMYFDQNEIEKIKKTQETGKFDEILELRKEFAMSAADNLFKINLDGDEDPKKGKAKKK
jgi:hypothetical protein